MECFFETEYNKQTGWRPNWDIGGITMFHFNHQLNDFYRFFTTRKYSPFALDSAVLLKEKRNILRKIGFNILRIIFDKGKLFFNYNQLCEMLSIYFDLNYLPNLFVTFFSLFSSWSFCLRHCIFLSVCVLLWLSLSLSLSHSFLFFFRKQI